MVEETVKLFIVFFPLERQTFVCDTMEEAISCAEIEVFVQGFSNYFLIKEF